MPMTKKKKEAPTQTKTTWTTLKKQLATFDEAGLIQLIHDLYKANDFNKAFMKTRLFPEDLTTSEEVLKLKKRVFRLMSPNWDSGWGEYKDPDYTGARRIIRDYKKTGDTLGTLDLMLTFVEGGNTLTVKYGDIDSRYYDNLCGMLGKFTDELLTHSDLISFFAERLEALYESSREIGWGYSDYIHDVLKELKLDTKNDEPSKRGLMGYNLMTGDVIQIKPKNTYLSPADAR
jgi:hypothetical protein